MFTGFFVFKNINIIELKAYLRSTNRSTLFLGVFALVKYVEKNFFFVFYYVESRGQHIQFLCVFLIRFESKIKECVSFVYTAFRRNSVNKNKRNNLLTFKLRKWHS